MCVVGESGTVGIGPVGARRMIRVRESDGDAVGSDGRGAGGGWFGAVTSSSVVADEDTPLRQPGHGVDPLGAPL